MIQTYIQKLNSMPIFLEEKEHIYYYNNSEKFTSVSKILSTLQSSFEADKMALKCSTNPAHEHFGKQPQEIIKIWENKNKLACNNGSGFHEYAEHKILSCNQSFVPSPLTQAFDNFYNSTLSKIDYIVLEKAICYPKYRIAGTPDYIGLFKNNLFIFDWKTNSKFDTQNDFKLLSPFSFLDKSKLTLYTLQVYIYRFILENAYNISVNDIRIVWFFDKDKNALLQEDLKYCSKQGEGWAIFKPKFQYQKELIIKIIENYLSKNQ